MQFRGSTRLHGASGTPPPTAYTEIGVYPGGPMTSIGPYRVRVETFGPGGVKLSGGGKALRKMQHSCIF